MAWRTDDAKSAHRGPASVLERRPWRRDYQLTGIPHLAEITCCCMGSAPAKALYILWLPSQSLSPTHSGRTSRSDYRVQNPGRQLITVQLDCPNSFTHADRVKTSAAAIMARSTDSAAR